MNDQPSSAGAFAQQAFYFIERRRLADARRVLKDGLSQFPQDPDLLFHSAQVEWLNDENAAAEATARQVLSLAPEHRARAPVAREPAHRARATLPTPKRCSSDCCATIPRAPSFYGRYSRLMLRTLHLDKAEQLAREGLRYDPDDRECLLAMALCETARGGSRAERGPARN